MGWALVLCHLERVRVCIIWGLIYAAMQSLDNENKVRVHDRIVNSIIKTLLTFKKVVRLPSILILNHIH